MTGPRLERWQAFACAALAGLAQQLGEHNTPKDVANDAANLADEMLKRYESRCEK